MRRYSTRMQRVRARRRKLGICDARFDADFEERERPNRDGVAEMLAGSGRTEKNPDFNPGGLPLREDLTSTDEDVVTQSRLPEWHNGIKVTVQDWRNQLPAAVRHQGLGPVP